MEEDTTNFALSRLCDKPQPLSVLLESLPSSFLHLVSMRPEITPTLNNSP